MIFKGQRWTKAKKVVILPFEFWNGKDKNYVAFGRACSKDTKGAIKTRYTWGTANRVGDQVYPSPMGDMPEPNDEGELHYPVYVLEVPADVDEGEDPKSGRGYSLTNLMYGKDGYAYLYLDGHCYVRKIKPRF